MIYYRTSTTAASGQNMGLPFLGGDDTGGGLGGVRGICPEEEEYGCTVHCNATDSVTLQEDGAESGGLF